MTLFTVKCEVVVVVVVVVLAVVVTTLVVMVPIAKLLHAGRVTQSQGR
jgi:hypothetical protein